MNLLANIHLSHQTKTKAFRTSPEEEATHIKSGNSLNGKSPTPKWVRLISGGLTLSPEQIVGLYQPGCPLLTEEGILAPDV